MAKTELPNYDYVFNPEDWEATYHDTCELGEQYVEDSDLGTVFEAQTLIEGPKIYGARVPTSFDEDGDWDGEEVQWFATKEEAEAAANRKADKPVHLTQEAYLTEKVQSFANLQAEFVCEGCNAPLAVRAELNREGKFVEDGPAFRTSEVSRYGLGLSLIVQPCERCIERATKPARDLTQALRAALDAARP